MHFTIHYCPAAVRMLINVASISMGEGIALLRIHTQSHQQFSFHSLLIFLYSNIQEPCLFSYSHLQRMSSFRDVDVVVDLEMHSVVI